MNTKILLVTLLLCFSLVSATLKLQVSSGSNKNWIAVKDIDADVKTTSIAIKQNNGEWTEMSYEAEGRNTGYWTYNDWSKSSFDLPLSVRMTGVNGVQITFDNTVSTFPGERQTFDSHTQYVVEDSTDDDDNTDLPLKLRVSSGSNKNWIAVQVIDEALPTSTVEIKQASSVAWIPMELQVEGRNIGYWTYNDWSKSEGFDLPLSFRFVGSNGFTVTINGAISTFPGVAQLYDTHVQYTAGGRPVNIPPVVPTPPSAATTRPTQAATAKPTEAATARPTEAATAKPTEAATSRPTEAATTRPTQAATTRPTQAATTRPTQAATARPTQAATTRPTEAPTTKPTAAPTQKATVKPTTKPSTGCNAPMKMLVPLYMYPGSQWDTVLESAKIVETVAIINPSSGPGSNGPSNSFKTYMAKFDNAGIEMIGYVHTSYGARSISTVKKEIDEYASKFTSVVGIFLDEVSAKEKDIPYYKELHEYIMDMPGWKYNVINPGAVPAEGYLAVATQIVSFETDHTKLAASRDPAYASCANKDKFSVITYGATSSTYRAVVDNARNKGYYGWVYTTQDRYTVLPPYYSDMAKYIADGN